MLRKLLATLLIVLFVPLAAHADDKDKAELRELVVTQVGEVIALVSLCRGLQPNIENMSLVLMRIGLNFDDIIDDAGKYSKTITPQMAESGGEEAACAAGAAWYGPKGNKVPNFVTLR